VKIARARPDRFWPAFFACPSVCLSVRVPVCRPKFGSTKAGASSSFERRPKFLHRPKRLPCDSASAGAATQQIAPPTRAPAGRGPTDACHGRHARSRSHHGHRAATVTPESLQAAAKLPCATTLSSLDAAVVTRRRHRVTSFAFPSGGGANRRVSTPSTRPLRRRGPRRAECIYGSECEDCVPHACRPPPPMAICIKDCMIGMPSYASDGDCDGGGPGAQELVTRLCRMRPALPASSAHLRRDADDDARGFAGCATGLPTTAAPARSSARPRAVTCGKEKV